MLANAGKHGCGTKRVRQSITAGSPLQRRVLVELSHFMSLLPVLENSDMIATVPRDLADVCQRYADLRIVEPPLKAPVIAVHQFWHLRFHQDPANVWLRGMVRSLFPPRG
ncbi:MAG TPA: hypothetical protein VFO28_19485 [Burkholderiaceae bacterium]|nr:hypothetical protein [Burkholderiaceae bacterium]